MSVTVYGASDDLVEVKGDIRAEFSAAEDGGYLAFSDGTLLSIDFTAAGIWRIIRLVKGAASVTNIEGDVKDGNYSDRVTVTSSVPIRWVLYGGAVAR